MILQQEIRIADLGGFGYARATECNFGIEQTMFGYRLVFGFKVEPYPRDNDSEILLLDWEIDLYHKGESSLVLMGRMLPERGEPNWKLERYGFTVNRYFELRSDEFLQLVDKSHRGDVVFEFHATPLLRGSKHEASATEGRLIIPRSTWLDCVNRMGLDRYELIVIRVPVAASHLHQPFVDALAKIREAEGQYTRGDWNGTAASCRSAWNTVLSSVPKNTKREQRLEILLQEVSGDPRRRKFALAVMKAFNIIVNEAVHLEGDVKTGTPPTDLRPEDALLCIHWYTAAIGYLSSL
jgi:hypothetical protein